MAPSAVGAIPIRGSSDAAGSNELSQDFSDVAGADARRVAQLPLRERGFSFGENLFYALPGGRLGRLGFSRLLIHELESEGWWVGFYRELQAIGAGRRTMFDIQIQMWAVTAQVQVGVPPGVEFGRSPERLATPFMGGSFASMVHQYYGSAVVALQAAQISEQWGDLGSEVLIDTMQTNQRIEHKQFGFEASDRGVKRPLLLGVIEPKGRHGDDVDVEAVEVGAGCGGDALEALSHDVWGILGGEQQDGATLPGHKVAQAGGAGSHRDGKIQCEKGFSAFGFATDNTDGLRTPQTFDQPRLFLGLRRGELRRTGCWQSLHGRVAPMRRLRGSGGAKTSK
jgi:hypothetical protein